MTLSLHFARQSQSETKPHTRRQYAKAFIQPTLANVPFLAKTMRIRAFCQVGDSTNQYSIAQVNDLGGRQGFRQATTKMVQVSTSVVLLQGVT
jgi:hypothetical protein